MNLGSTKCSIKHEVLTALVYVLHMFVLMSLVGPLSPLNVINNLPALFEYSNPIGVLLNTYSEVAR